MPNEIRVVIEDKTGSGGGSTENLTPQKASTNASAQTPQSATNRTYMKGLATASMIASGAFNYMTSNVGKYTGSSHTQNLVNNIQQGIQLGAMAIVNPYLALGAIAVQGISYVLDENWRKRQESVELGQARARAGYSSSDAVTSRRTYNGRRN